MYHPSLRLCMLAVAVLLVVLTSVSAQDAARAQALRERITKERLESQELLKQHKMLKAQGRTQEAAKAMELIVGRKAKLNKELAEESGIDDTYLKYKSATGTRRKHPFASTGADKMSRLEWEEKRNGDMKSDLNSKCDTLHLRVKDALLPPDEAKLWGDKIELLRKLQFEFLDRQLEISRETEMVRTIKEPGERATFLEDQKRRRKERMPQERANFELIESTHKELSAKFPGVLPNEREL